MREQPFNAGAIKNKGYCQTPQFSLIFFTHAVLTPSWHLFCSESRGKWGKICDFADTIWISCKNEKSSETHCLCGFRGFSLAGAQRLELWTRGFGDREKSPKNRINTRFFWKWHIFWHIETEENEALPCFACAFYCDLRYTYEQGNSICDSEGAENNAILQRGLYVRGRSAQPRDFSRV